MDDFHIFPTLETNREIEIKTVGIFSTWEKRAPLSIDEGSIQTYLGADCIWPCTASCKPRIPELRTKKKKKKTDDKKNAANLSTLLRADDEVGGRGNGASHQHMHRALH